MSKRRGHVVINVRQYADGRWGWNDYSSGVLKKIRLKTQKKATNRANDISALLARGRTDLLAIDRGELARFREWEAGKRDSQKLGEVVAEFLSLKEARSRRHYESVRADLRTFMEHVGNDVRIGNVTPAVIEQYLASQRCGPRRRYNLRASVVALFRWARRRKMLPDETTAAERVEPIARIPGEPNILTPEQAETLLLNVEAKFLPWLAIGLFAGVRGAEIYSRHGEHRLAWEDFKWAKGFIDLRAETSKIKERRHIPIHPNLALWLASWRNSRGSVCKVSPYRSETRRLGKLIGGWKSNYLRDSYASYRMAIIENMPQLAFEMGNSVAMIRHSYHDRTERETAERYFGLAPKAPANVLAMTG